MLLADGWEEGEGLGMDVRGSKGFEFVRGGRGGVYGFSSLLKQNKKGKNCAVFCFTGFFFQKKICYEVIVKQIFYKRAANHYWPSLNLTVFFGVHVTQAQRSFILIFSRTGDGDGSLMPDEINQQISLVQSGLSLDVHPATSDRRRFGRRGRENERFGRRGRENEG
jgi:hypothetical protein